MKAKTLPGAVGYDVLQYCEGENTPAISLDGEYEVISTTDSSALIEADKHGVLVVALSNLTVTAEEAYKRGQEAFNDGRMAAPALDRVFIAVLSSGKQVGSGIDALLAWNKGWREASLEYDKWAYDDC